MGSATDQKISPIPCPQAKSIEYHAKRPYSGLAPFPPSTMEPRSPIAMYMQNIKAIVASTTKYQVKFPVTKVLKEPMARAAASPLSTAKTTTTATRTRLTVLIMRSSHRRGVMADADRTRPVSSASSAPSASDVSGFFECFS